MTDRTPTASHPAADLERDAPASLDAGARPLAGARVDQVLPNISPGDAASDAALAFEAMLRGAGADSCLWSRDRHPARASSALELDLGRLKRRAPDLVLLHHATGSGVPAALIQADLPLALYFHNVTPPRYLLGANDLLAGLAWRGLADLPRLLRSSRVAMAPSRFSLEQLRAAGAVETALVPIPVDSRVLAVAPDPEVLARLRDGGPTLLFVGRIAPNKRQDDLLRLFHYYARGHAPGARLLLVGSDAASPLYRAWLERAIEAWGLREVYLTGHVSDAARAAYYRSADVFISLSEHEGFGVPLIEAMQYGVPVIARDAAAVAETVGSGGLLVDGSDHRRVAALVASIVESSSLRDQLAVAGRARAAELAPDRVAPRLVTAIARALGRPTALGAPS